jgi:hypothetical protein
MPNLTTAEYEAKAAARFWRHVDKTGNCWIWTGTKSDNGYGRHSMTYPGEKAYDVKAHRYSWALANGPIPEGIEIDHACHTTLCVNPDHLRAATRKQNSENRQGASKNSKSGIRGVFWEESRGKWRARLSHNKKQIHAGFFDTAKEAEAAAIAKRLELYTHNVADRATANRAA